MFRLGRALGRARLLHVTGDLSHQLVLARERPLFPQPPPELYDEAPAVEIALEVEQIRFDPALVATVVGIALGGIAGYRGGWADALITRLGDMFGVLPAIMLLLIAETVWLVRRRAV